MFGQMNVIEVLDLRNAPAEVADSSEGPEARLLEVTDHPKDRKMGSVPEGPVRVPCRSRRPRVRCLLRV
jgi:hypothetical protein